MSIRTFVVALAASAALAGTAFAQSGTADQQPSCSCPGHQGQAGMGMGANTGAGTGAGMGMGGNANAGNMPMMHGGMCGHMAQMQMSQMANVSVQDTPQGAIVRFDAKDPSQVASIQGMAQKMGSCIASSAQAPNPSAPTR